MMLMIGNQILAKSIDHVIITTIIIENVPLGKVANFFTLMLTIYCKYDFRCTTKKCYFYHERQSFLEFGMSQNTPRSPAQNWNRGGTGCESRQMRPRGYMTQQIQGLQQGTQWNRSHQNKY